MGLLNKISEESKNALKSKAKKAIKAVIRPILIKTAIIIAIVVSIITMLSSFWYIIKKDTVKETSKAIRNDGEEPAVVIDSSKREYNLDTEFAKRVEDILEDLSINTESIGLTEELLIKMYEAEIITSYPDLRERSEIGTEIGDNELQGCIQFIRKYADGTEENLEYMDYSEFQIKLAELGSKLEDAEGNTVEQEKIYTAQDEVEKKYNELRRYFTLDEEYNVVIATINTTKTITQYSQYAIEEENTDSTDYIYTVSYKKINYQSQVKKYAMPVEFPLSILAITENPGFCEAILELVSNSKIIIEVQDNLTTTTMVEKYDYDAYFNIHKKLNYTIDVEIEVEDEDTSGEEETEEEETTEIIKPTKPTKPSNPSDGPVAMPVYYSTLTELNFNNGYTTMINLAKTITQQKDESSSSTSKEQHLKKKDIDNNPFSTITTISNQNNIKLCIVQVNTWLLDAESIYTREDATTPTTSSITLDDDTEYQKVEDYHKFLKDYTFSLEPGAYNISTDENQSYIEEKQINKEKIINITAQKVTYTKTSSTVTQREERFLSLLAVNPLTGEFDKEDTSKNTKLIKYKDVYGRNTSPEENLLTTKQMLFEFLSISEESQSFEEIMRYLLYIYTGKSYGVTTLDFSIYEENEFISVSNGTIVGNSIQEKVWWALKNLGYSDYAVSGAMGNIHYESAGFSTSAVEGGSGEGIGLLQWSFGRRIQLETYANSKGVSWQDEDTQVEFLIAEISGQGPASAYATRRTAGYIKEEGKEYTAYHSDWEIAITIDDSTLAFMRFFESPASVSSYSQRCIYAEKYYNEFQGKTAPTYTGELGDKANLIVAWAEQQIGKSQFYNSHNGKMEVSNERCAAFAKSAYYEAGLGYTYGNAIDIAHPNAIQYNENGKVDCSNIPIGAFIVSSGTSSYGHVALYVGDGYVIEAGGKTIVKQKIDSSYGKGKFLGWGCTS